MSGLINGEEALKNWVELRIDSTFHKLKKINKFQNINDLKKLSKTLNTIKSEIRFRIVRNQYFTTSCGRLLANTTIHFFI